MVVPAGPHTLNQKATETNGRQVICTVAGNPGVFETDWSAFSTGGATVVRDLGPIDVNFVSSEQVLIGGFTPTVDDVAFLDCRVNGLDVELISPLRNAAEGGYTNIQTHGGTYIVALRKLGADLTILKNLGSPSDMRCGHVKIVRFITGGVTLPSLLQLAGSQLAAAQTQVALQALYDGALGAGGDAPDAVPAEATAAAQALGGATYKIYLGHNVWWYTNNNTSWTQFGASKGSFGADSVVTWTFK